MPQKRSSRRGKRASRGASRHQGHAQYGQMTPKKINERKAQDAIRYDLAVQIRELLDAARKNYGAQEWDDNDVETAVLDMVTEED